MADNYLSFNYKRSDYTSGDKYRLYADFNGFIINEGSDLTFFNPSNFSHEFEAPQFGNWSYYLGTSKENREFNFPIFLMGVTLIQYRQFLDWLDPAYAGILYFDWESDYGYDVRVNSISEGKFYVDQNCVGGTPGTATYNIELTVGFTTLYDYAARWLATIAEFNIKGSATGALSGYNNSSSVPFAKVVSYTNATYLYTYVVDIRNYNNIDNYLKISWNWPMTSASHYIEILDGANTLYKIYYKPTDSSTPIDLRGAVGTIYTQFGLIMNSTSFINLGTRDINDGVIAFLPNIDIPPTPLISRTLTIKMNGSAAPGGSHYLRVYPISREVI